MSVQPVDELQTLRDLLRYGVSRFRAASLYFGHGCDNAWDEAVYLGLYALNIPAEQLEGCLDARLLRSEREQVLALFERRITEVIPAAYLTGEAWLLGYRFRVDPRVIVPRSYIARLLLEESLQPWLPKPESLARVLDVCTGSACLAILAAQLFEQAHIDAVDCSAEALAVAAGNVKDYGLEDRIRLIEGDVFEPLEQEARYNLIIANPPYVKTESMQTLPKEYLHEPEIALAGGRDGLDLVTRIINGAARYLAPEGLLLIEIGHNRVALEAEYPTLAGIWMHTDGEGGEVLLLTRSEIASADSIRGLRAERYG